MPPVLKTGLESLSGMDLSPVRVHFNSPRPNSLGALAYTQGANIHLAPGQERCLPHEGWHVVQQAQGRVKTTVRADSVALNRDRELEREADTMGEQAARVSRVGPAADVRRRQLVVPSGAVVIQRWENLGAERWSVPGPLGGGRDMTVWTGSQEEWMSELDNMDDESEYRERLWGFLELSNDPSIVDRDRPPRHIGNVPYSNTIVRAPTDAEKLEFLRALYAMSGNLDLWHGGALEGGKWVRSADREMSTFIRNYQGMLIADAASPNQVLSESLAVAEQGGHAATMAMIVNAGATAHKGVDLLMAAGQQSGTEREKAKFNAYRTISSAGMVIRQALHAHNARVAFQQQLIGIVFNTVWGMIPGGGAIADAGKALLKAGLEEGLKKTQEESAPSQQVEKLDEEFVATCRSLVSAGHVTADAMTMAINGFHAGLR